MKPCAKNLRRAPSARAPAPAQKTASGPDRGSLAPRTDARPVLIPAIKTALGLLLEAHEAAVSLDRDKWDFALEIQELKEAGLNHNDLRSLVFQGLAEHRLEQTRGGAKRRAFHQPRCLRLHKASCFALSSSGLLLARQVLVTGGTLPVARADAPSSMHQRPHLPVWDSDRRELRLGVMVVKRFRQPARNQETILAAFQEDGWPPHIDNPLSGNGDTDAKDRLHDAVKMLNRHTRQVFRFFSDGLGRGVVWEFVNASVPGAS